MLVGSLANSAAISLITALVRCTFDGFECQRGGSVLSPELSKLHPKVSWQ